MGLCSDDYQRGESDRVITYPIAIKQGVGSHYRIKAYDSICSIATGYYIVMLELLWFDIGVFRPHNCPFLVQDIKVFHQF